MKKLNKEHRATRDRLMSELEVAQMHVEQAIEAYRAKVQETQAFCQDVAEEIATYINDKSDRWQEGDRGQAYSDWQQMWEGVEFPEFIADDDAQASERLLDLDEGPAS